MPRHEVARGKTEKETPRLGRRGARQTRDRRDRRFGGGAATGRTLEKGMAKGMEKGREEGRVEGRAEGIENVARKLKAEGVAVEIIMSATGLSRADLEKL